MPFRPGIARSSIAGTRGSTAMRIRSAPSRSWPCASAPRASPTKPSLPFARITPAARRRGRPRVAAGPVRRRTSRDVAFYRWDGPARPARTRRGPAVITGGEATAVVPPGWRFRIDGFGNCASLRGSTSTARGRKLAHEDSSRSSSRSSRTCSCPSPRRWASRCAAPASRRTSRSGSTIRAPSTTRGGETIAQGDHMPVHLGAMPLSVRAAIDAFPMEPGDIVMLNDPFHGGTHLPDITLVSPVFLGRETRGPAFYVANRAHHSDVGGMSPGSMPVAREIYQEGLILPPVQLARRGRIVPDVLALSSPTSARPTSARAISPRRSPPIAWPRRGCATRCDATAARRTLALRRRAAGLHRARAARRHSRQFPTAATTFEDALDDDGFGRRPGDDSRGGHDRGRPRDDRLHRLGRRRSTAASTPTTRSRCRRASTRSAAWSATTCCTTRASARAADGHRAGGHRSSTRSGRRRWPAATSRPRSASPTSCSARSARRCPTACRPPARAR